MINDRVRSVSAQVSWYCVVFVWNKVSAAFFRGTIVLVNTLLVNEVFPNVYTLWKISPKYMFLHYLIHFCFPSALLIEDFHNEEFVTVVGCFWLIYGVFDVVILKLACKPIVYVTISWALSRGVLATYIKNRDEISSC